MNRKEFLILSAVAATSVVINTGVFGKLINQSVQVEAGGKLLRGTNDGRIETSDNESAYWQTHSTFGEDVSILDLFTDRTGQVHAQLGFRGYIFHLRLSENGESWVSV